MKFGLDIHGTIDKMPKFFSIFSQRVVSKGNEVHIITGSIKTPEIVKQLNDYGIHYTHYFSVSERLLFEGKTAFWKNKDNPFFELEYWNPAKAKYCQENKIDLMIDDSNEYGKFFTTLYLKVGVL